MTPRANTKWTAGIIFLLFPCSPSSFQSHFSYCQSTLYLVTLFLNIWYVLQAPHFSLISRRIIQLYHQHITHIYLYTSHYLPSKSQSRFFLSIIINYLPFPSFRFSKFPFYSQCEILSLNTVNLFSSLISNYNWPKLIITFVSTTAPVPGVYCLFSGSRSWIIVG